MKRYRRLIPPLSVLLGLGVLAALGWQYSPVELIASVTWKERYWPIVVVGLFGLFLVRPFLLWPLSTFSILIGYVFGFPYGVPLALIGTSVTCLPPFLLARRFDGHFAYTRWLTNSGSALTDTTGGVRTMTAARLSPAPADVVSYSAGIVGVRLRTFVVGTIIGEVPWAMFYVSFGQSLQEVATAELAHVDFRFLLATTISAFVLAARPLYTYLHDRFTGLETNS